ncbi:MAG TPA: T9SS type A sorting domain-containing protein [Cyclobacteriaceae bacterium]|nr:T9SS type A sorting domain-containing protein [Cyclobacteriaceae bacterium]HMV88456.1 T9SS type A sorting domain-containing protein [Cyclobacteriaceae bacterium]HNC10390.1 T9SS type A sorting domain-containing protein [Cyclobacteriaceae bacterium]HND40992.1 T9SS type A sorting domain-containing protein [Cyclobacteriaceae bacterium]HNF78546.1 T9SS type A sorting domain-containing protein [Cyclobacteriaceae bacterium]
MRNLATCTLMIAGLINAFAAEINSIEGNSPVCPQSTTTYTVNYALNFTNTLTTFDEVKSVKWEFIQNGIVVKTLFSSTFVPIAPTGSAKINVSGLSLGLTKIRVTLNYYLHTPYSVAPLNTQKTRDIFVGIPDPTIINGDVICPGSTALFSIGSLPNATSYTWEVPAGWRVNGVIGPVVANQGMLVSIQPCSDTTCKPIPLSAFTIKVKGVSASCGQSNYSSKTIKIDHQVNITETNFPYNDVKLSASPTNFPSYQWTLDPAWYFPANGNKNLPEVSFNSRGLTGLATLTYTTPCQNTYTRNWWWVLPNTGGPGSPGNPGDPQPDPGDCDPEIPVSYMPNAKAMNVVYLKAPCDEEPPAAALYSSDTGSLKSIKLVRNGEGFEYDISSLKPGVYIMQVKTSKGKHKTMKFIKMD